MGLKLRPGFSWFQQTKAVRWNLPRLMMNRQLEAIGEEGLHHQAHLVLGGIAFDARLYVKPIGEDPSRQLGLQGVHLVTRDLVREQNVAEERIIRSREISAIGDVNISGTKREVGLRLVVRLVRLDRRDVELRHSPASPRLSPPGRRIQKANCNPNGYGHDSRRGQEYLLSVAQFAGESIRHDALDSFLQL